MEENKDDDQPKEEPRSLRIIKVVLHVLFHIVFISYFIWCTIAYINYDRNTTKCEKPTENLTTTSPDDNGYTDANTEADADADPKGMIVKREVGFVPHILCHFNWCHGYGFLIVMLVIVYILWLYYWVFKPLIGKRLNDTVIEPGVDKWIEFSRRTVVSIIMLVVVIVLVTVFLGIECRDNPRKLVGLTAPIFFIFLGFAISRNRSAIPWRIIVHGLLCQLILGIFCIHLPIGRAIFDCAGEKAARFLSFARYGALFAYGERICNEYVFAFAVLAVVFFFSVVTSCLYYLGVMQHVLSSFGFLVQAIVGTTVCESINAVGNIFLGMSESPLMIRPYLPLLTRSELHAICVSGYATVSGSVMGAYITFGASPAYLITASVMAAPGSLAFAKLFYPETEESRTKAENIELEKSPDASILDAAAAGAAAGLMIVLSIVANIIAFLAIVFFFNAVVEWMFALAGFDGITFIYLLTKLFIPLVYLMGVISKDCEKVALLVAQKTVINEFVGYKHLGEMITNKEIEPRSAGIATFALCGFANPGSLGILIASLSAMAPTRRPEIVKVAVRAFLVGSIVSFTSASIAGILIQEEDLEKLGRIPDGSDFIY